MFKNISYSNKKKIKKIIGIISLIILISVLGYLLKIKINSMRIEYVRADEDIKVGNSIEKTKVNTEKIFLNDDNLITKKEYQILKERGDYIYFNNIRKDDLIRKTDLKFIDYKLSGEKIRFQLESKDMIFPQNINRGDKIICSVINKKDDSKDNNNNINNKKVLNNIEIENQYIFLVENVLDSKGLEVFLDDNKKVARIDIINLIGNINDQKELLKYQLNNYEVIISVVKVGSKNYEKLEEKIQEKGVVLDEK
ncbi:MAG: hypothetical protein ACQEQF_08835 [Bacillota bacterium]